MKMEKVILVTGSGGLVGSEVCRFYLNKGFKVFGIDNDMRQEFFGKDASTKSTIDELLFNDNYIHKNIDIRNYSEIEKLFKTYGEQIECVVHTAAQPSHDWASKDPLTDYSVNSTGTINLLEAYRLNCPKAAFIFTSTNKVYGDTPNKIDFFEDEKRYTPNDVQKYSEGIDEHMSIDQSLHSVFGASKVSADIMVQEYGRYFNLNTAVFRGGCLTGPKHKGVELHGFLSYLVKCAIHNKSYTIYGYKGKQVRDNIHSEDLVKAFDCYYRNPSKPGVVYNIGGGKYSNCSIIEAIDIIEEISGKRLNYNISETVRSGDHQWWISDLTKFKSDYPEWSITKDIKSIIKDIVEYEIRSVEEKTIKDKILDYIIKEFGEKQTIGDRTKHYSYCSFPSEDCTCNDLRDIKYDTTLITGGYIDSFSMVMVLDFLEKEFKIQIPNKIATPENFNTVNNMYELVKFVKINK